MPNKTFTFAWITDQDIKTTLLGMLATHQALPIAEFLRAFTSDNSYATGARAEILLTKLDEYMQKKDAQHKSRSNAKQQNPTDSVAEKIGTVPITSIIQALNANAPKPAAGQGSTQQSAAELRKKTPDAHTKKVIQQIRDEQTKALSKLTDSGTQLWGKTRSITATLQNLNYVMSDSHKPDAIKQSTRQLYIAARNFLNNAIIQLNHSQELLDKQSKANNSDLYTQQQAAIGSIKSCLEHAEQGSQAIIALWNNNELSTREQVYLFSAKLVDHVIKWRDALAITLAPQQQIRSLLGICLELFDQISQPPAQLHIDPPLPATPTLTTDFKNDLDKTIASLNEVTNTLNDNVTVASSTTSTAVVATGQAVLNAVAVDHQQAVTAQINAVQAAIEEQIRRIHADIKLYTPTQIVFNAAVYSLAIAATVASVIILLHCVSTASCIIGLTMLVTTIGLGVYTLHRYYKSGAQLHSIMPFKHRLASTLCEYKTNTLHLQCYTSAQQKVADVPNHDAAHPRPVTYKRLSR